MADGRCRVVIEGVSPEIDCGRFAIKRVTGEQVVVEADIYADGHDEVAAVLCYRRGGEESWIEIEMAPLVNDRWRASFPVSDLGRYEYTIVAWVDRFRTWEHDLEKRVAAGQDVSVDLRIGAELVSAAAARAPRADAVTLQGIAEQLDTNAAGALDAALAPELGELMWRYAPRDHAVSYDKALTVRVDPPLARFSAWYELFPRSTSPEPGRHGTLRDVERLLPYVSELGFDILYLPPIHPIGRQFRKGRNNTTDPDIDDPGSPWAIGGPEGGHKDVHPELGTLEDVRHLADAARERGIALALDIAFQSSPDHPYVASNTSWFRARPDGTIQYAENPPKKYQDIYPFDFESDDWQAMWDELTDVVRHWCKQGVRVFRVDNPHTKPFAFWESLIATIKGEYPETIFLSEAFTRPKVMARLAKVGFTQSYTYFTWRNTRWELEEYLTQLTRTELQEYFRPNFWPNTPDILPEHLQFGGRPMFIARLVLAATLSSNYGIYGPAFELQEHQPLAPGREEYLDSEKYEIRRWDLERPDSLREVITLVNRIRREHPALQRNDTLQFHPTDNDQLIAYTKRDESGDVVLTVVNLDPHHTQSGWVDLQIQDLGIDPHEVFQVHDLLGGGHYLWSGYRNFVQLDPQAMPAHIFHVRRHVRTEQDFDYFM
ncbi:MAG TPA: alpha-1,4-glucan--maltose-1-phosphate maltosyltransferase [Thermomicrobiales bacterium]|mgnify:CR=1 FL=1|nr:alpha-1,4-glucan--maltose-1-phosphate maltosyltransferase [Thermomicrobiales bacterium]